jgi:hypothetical protein
MRALNLVFAIFFVSLLPACMDWFKGGVKKEWEAREGRMAEIDARMKELAAEIKEVAGPATCKTSSDCRMVGLGAKVCNGYHNVLIYSMLSTQEEKLLPLIADFNRLARELHDKQLSVPSCGKPVGTVECHHDECTPVGDTGAVLHGRD